MRLAKDLGVTTLIVGHVTKDGAIAGPRVLEHMVDAVLYFEGDRDHAFRIVRAVKNRFGSSSEIGIFEMGERGLLGVGSPSAALLVGARRGRLRLGGHGGDGGLAPAARRDPGARDAELPADAAAARHRHRDGAPAAGARRARAPSRALASPARTSTCRSPAACASLEPAVDLPLALALASALKDVPVPRDVAAFGELGLTGQVRPVSHGEHARQGGVAVRDAARLGGRSRLARPRGRGCAGAGGNARATRCGCSASRHSGGTDAGSAGYAAAESWQNRSRRRRERTGTLAIDPKTRELLREELKKVAPGTHLREGLDMILAARPAR